MLVSSFARSSLRRAVAANLRTPANAVRTMSSNVSGFPAPRLFDYETVTSNLTVKDAIESVEEAFGALAEGKVDGTKNHHERARHTQLPVEACVFSHYFRLLSQFHFPCTLV